MSNYIDNIYNFEMDVVLWDQLEPVTLGALSQKFPPVKVSLDSIGADDFLIPLDETWTINRVRANGIQLGNLAATYNVGFYNPSLVNLGIPVETPFATFSDIVPISNVAGDVTLDLPSPFITLGSGNYWVSVQANLDSGFDPTTGGIINGWFWGSIGNQRLSPSVYKNPGNGFFLNAQTWTETTTVVPLVNGPDFSYLLRGIKSTIPPPCLHPTTEVQTFQGLKQIKDIKAGDYVVDYRGNPVKVTYNILFAPKTDQFVRIPANSIEKGMPQKEILIRKSHPIRYKGKEVDPLKLAAKLGKSNIIREVKIANYAEVWSLCTKERTFVMMQGIPVATWEQNDWEQNVSKKMGVAWTKK